MYIFGSVIVIDNSLGLKYLGDPPGTPIPFQIPCASGKPVPRAPAKSSDPDLDEHKCSISQDFFGALTPGGYKEKGGLLAPRLHSFRSYGGSGDIPLSTAIFQTDSTGRFSRLLMLSAKSEHKPLGLSASYVPRRLAHLAVWAVGCGCVALYL